MKSLKYLILSVIFACVGALTAQAQIVAVNHETISADSARRAFNDQPHFGLYKDNYFVFGPPIGKRITSENTNVKFQISIAQKVTKSVLPFGTYLYLFYTQKCFWNVCQNSMPMTDLNFNPGLGIAKPLYVHNKFIGKAIFMIEHESNGRDGEDSRSWNKVSFGANIMIDNNIMVHGKTWIPIIDSDNNRDILKYCGIYQAGMQVMSNDHKFNGSLTLVKRQGWNMKYNVIGELGMRLWRNANEYLFLQLYSGYGEGLLEYNKFHCNLRIGIQIKPRFFSDF